MSAVASGELKPKTFLKAHYSQGATGAELHGDVTVAPGYGKTPRRSRARVASEMAAGFSPAACAVSLIVPLC